MRSESEVRKYVHAYLEIAAENIVNYAYGNESVVPSQPTPVQQPGLNQTIAVAPGTIVIPQPTFNPVPTDSGFKFGRKSETELVGVKPELVNIARLALKLSTQDFMIFDGLRTLEEQKAYVAKGTSKTLNSKHLKQSDGYSHAIDCVPVNSNGLPVWDWNLIWPVAFAVDEAATRLGFAKNIVWGGAWDRRLSDFGGNAQLYKKETELYAQRNPGKSFLDGPHFEWRT